MSDTPEQLWTRAHENVRRGDFASAVRDLAQCFQMLQAAQDPRVYEVHKRWTEVHKMYLEDGQRQPAPQAQRAPSVEAEAEAAANAGNLDKAIALYEQVVKQSPQNELVRERLNELLQAKRRATELVAGKAAPAPAAAAAKPAQDENDWSDVSIDEPAKPAAAKPSVAAAIPAKPAPAVAKAAPTMAVDDAPVGMQSLDVPFSVGPAIDSEIAEELPVATSASAPPKPAHATASARAAGSDDDVAFLEELLARVQANRRRSA